MNIENKLLKNVLLPFSGRNWNGLSQKTSFPSLVILTQKCLIYQFMNMYMVQTGFALRWHFVVGLVRL